MRRVARGCLHFVQVSLPLIYPFRSSYLHRRHSLAAFRSIQIASSSTPSKKSPRVHGSQFSLSNKCVDPFGSPKQSASLMEEFGTGLRPLPLTVVVQSIRPHPSDCWWRSQYLLPPCCLFVTSFVPTSSHTKTLPNITFTTHSIGWCRVLLNQVVTTELEVSRWNFSFSSYCRRRIGKMFRVCW